MKKSRSNIYLKLSHFLVRSEKGFQDFFFLRTLVANFDAINRFFLLCKSFSLPRGKQNKWQTDLMTLKCMKPRNCKKRENCLSSIPHLLQAVEESFTATVG